MCLINAGQISLWKYKQCLRLCILCTYPKVWELFDMTGIKGHQQEQVKVKYSSVAL